MPVSSSLPLSPPYEEVFGAKKQGSSEEPHSTPKARRQPRASGLGINLAHCSSALKLPVEMSSDSNVFDSNYVSRHS